MRLFEIVKPSVHEDALLNKLIKLGKEHGVKDMYVTFTNLDKFTINPNTLYNTPMGLYAYPLSYVLRQRMENVPFASHAPFVWVFSASIPEDSVWNTKTDSPGIRSSIIKSVKDITGKTIPGDITDNKKLWRAMYTVIGTQAKPNKSTWEQGYKEQGTSEQAILSNKILIHAGIHAVIDPGTGTIHQNEKNQAVFFDIDELNVIQKFNNTLTQDLEKEKKLAHGNEKVPFKKRLETAISNGVRDLSLEQLPIPASVRPEELADYISNTGKNSWPAAEDKIASDSFASYDYARHVIKGKWPKGEPAVLTNARDALGYAKNVLKSRWPEGEPVIMQDPWQATMYARYVLRSRWPKAEPGIMKNSKARTEYKTTFGIE